MNKSILAWLAFLTLAPSVCAQDRYADMRKSMVELPTARLLKSTDTASLTALVPASDERVQPGLVRWHANYSEAVTASKSSGKRVLLLQLMGRLDEKFC